MGGGSPETGQECGATSREDPRVHRCVSGDSPSGTASRSELWSGLTSGETPPFPSCPASSSPYIWGGSRCPPARPGSTFTLSGLGCGGRPGQAGGRCTAPSAPTRVSHGLGLSSSALWQHTSLASPLQNTFRTPVYTTSMRRNAMGVGLVFEADLFTSKHISHWVLQGVCLTLNSD